MLEFSWQTFCANNDVHKTYLQQQIRLRQVNIRQKRIIHSRKETRKKVLIEKEIRIGQLSDEITNVLNKKTGIKPKQVIFLESGIEISNLAQKRIISNLRKNKLK
jgi:hypothetical protein